MLLLNGVILALTNENQSLMIVVLCSKSSDHTTVTLGRKTPLVLFPRVTIVVLLVMFGLIVLTMLAPFLSLIKILTSVRRLMLILS